MKVSARNVLQGSVQSVNRGAVNSEIALALEGGAVVTAIITNASADAMGLTPGKKACAIVKASSVMIGTDLGGARLSARNVMPGAVANLIEGAVNDEVHIDIGGGITLTAIITRGSANRLGLAPGGTVCAIIKASSVMIGIN